MSLNFFKYYGAKHYMLKHILPRIPKHSRYIEVFGGSAKVLLNKDVAPFEVYNDTNRAIYNLFRRLKDDFEEFQRRANLTLCHELNLKEPKGCETLEDAVSMYAALHQSFNGRGGSFSTSINRLRRNLPENVSSWLNKVDGLPLIYQRLSQVQFLCRDFDQIFRMFSDDRDTFFYCDPPYITGTRKSGAAYDDEMSDEQHKRLVDILLSLNSNCMLSGYKHPIYSELERNGWTRKDFPIESPNRKETKVESIWTNY